MPRADLVKDSSRRGWARRVRSAVVLLALALGSVVVDGGAAAAVDASLVVTPATALWTGEIVHVSSTTLPTGEHTWTLKQCAPGVGGCDVDASHYVEVTSNAGGVLAPTDFRVYRTVDVEVGGSTVPVDCGVSACTIEATGMGPSPGGPHADITFTATDPEFTPLATPHAGLWDGQTVTVSASQIPGDYEWTLEQCAPDVGSCAVGPGVVVDSSSSNTLPATAFKVSRSIDVGLSSPVDCTVHACTIEASGAGPSPGGPHVAIAFTSSARVGGSVTLAGVVPTGTQVGVLACPSTQAFGTGCPGAVQAPAPPAGGAYALTAPPGTWNVAAFARYPSTPMAAAQLTAPARVQLSAATVTPSDFALVSMFSTITRPGDFTGDGHADPAVFRPSSGTWFIRGVGATAFGGSGDIPVPGNWLGDARTDLAVFRPATGQWFVRGGGSFTFGGPGDIPVPANWVGDGHTDAAVFRPATGQWFVRGAAGPVTYGALGDIPVPGNWTGTGYSDLAFFRPTTGQWWIKGRPATTYGRAGDIPVRADWVGDAHTDLAVFRPSTGQWFVQGLATVGYGLPGDVPV